jgi:uncharacterized membrane protein
MNRVKSSHGSILLIGLGVLLAMASAFELEYLTRNAVFRQAGLIAVAVITFYGFLWYETRRHDAISESDMRRAITVSLVTVYLVLVGVVAFYTPVDPNSGRKLPDISNTMISSFTTLVAIVVPFYFGASAYVQAKREGRQKDQGQTPSEDTTS